MLATTLRHGDLVVDSLGDGSVRLTRQSTMETIYLSGTEWILLVKVSELFGWPTAPPTPEGRQALPA